MMITYIIMTIIMTIIMIIVIIIQLYFLSRFRFTSTNIRIH